MLYLQAFDANQLRKFHQANTIHVDYKKRQQNLKKVLLQLGVSQYDLRLPETRSLALLLRDDERLLSVVYGQYSQVDSHLIGQGMLAATDQRVLFIDKKLLFSRYEELPYGKIDGVTYSHAGAMRSVTLCSKMGRISLHTLNQFRAQTFVHTVEERISVPSPASSGVDI